MNSVTQVDQRAQEAGQFRADAEAGSAYLRQLADAWYEQGWNHYQMGGQWDELDLWSKEHQSGYLDALRGVRVVFLAAGAPALNRAGITQ